MSAKNLGKGGGESKGVRDVFQGGSAGGNAFWGGEVGDNPPYGPFPGGVSTQGGFTDNWEKYLADIGRDLKISTSGDGDEGVCAEEAEYIH